MKIARIVLAALLITPAAPLFAYNQSSDITEVRMQRIIAEAKLGQTALRRYANRLKTFNVNIDFDKALEIAQTACMADAQSRGTDVWHAARAADSACHGWTVRTLEPVTEESRKSMLAYLREVAQKQEG